MSKSVTGICIDCGCECFIKNGECCGCGGTSVSPYLEQQLDHPVADTADELASLRTTLAEREEQLKRAEGERDEAKHRCRRAAQTLIEKIGAPCPENVEETVVRAVAKLSAAERENERMRELLKELEWGGEHFTEPWCPVCKADVDMDNGQHEPGCRLYALLSPPTPQGEEVRDG